MRIDIIRRVDIAEPIQQGSLPDTLFYGDEYAHRIIAEVWKDGAKVDLTGAGVQGYVVRSDGVTIALTGRGVTTDDDGDTCRAYIDLLPDCYAVEGRVAIILKITGSTEVTTVLALWAKVAPSYTDAIQTVTDTLPDLSDVLAKLDAVETATAAANTAAAAASAAATSAEERMLCLASVENRQHVKMDDTMSLFIHQYYYLNASGRINRSSSTSTDVRTTQKLVAVPGDTINVTLSEAATSGRLVFAVLDKDGNLSHSLAAGGVDTMVSDEYTFGTGDAYFWLSGRYGKRAGFAVTYTPAVRE